MEISFKNLIELYKLASLGKVTGGLIHNINGPLQNIGLDLEMTQYMLKKEQRPQWQREHYSCKTQAY
jgi:C4-dicarboxylate-specific signal transduction histidine kinase